MNVYFSSVLLKIHYDQGERVSLYKILQHLRSFVFAFYILLSSCIHDEVYLCPRGKVAIVSTFSLSVWEEDLVCEILFEVNISLVVGELPPGNLSYP